MDAAPGAAVIAAPAPPHDIVLDAAEIACLPRVELEPGNTGVRFARTWADRDSVAGVMYVEPGAHLHAHSHRNRAHHAWVVSGTVRVLGRELGQGSYWFVPAGERHSLEGAAPDGCTLFYVFVGDGTE